MSNVLEQSVYVTTNVSASNFVLWSSMKNDVWFIGCSNISNVWTLKQSSKVRVDDWRKFVICFWKGEEQESREGENICGKLFETIC